RESGRTHGGVPVAGTAATDTLERGRRIRRAVSDPASLDRLLRQARRRTILFAFATFLVISALLTPRWIREPPPLTLDGFAVLLAAFLLPALMVGAAILAPRLMRRRLEGIWPRVREAGLGVGPLLVLDNGLLVQPGGFTFVSGFYTS